MNEQLFVLHKTIQTMLQCFSRCVALTVNNHDDIQEFIEAVDEHSVAVMKIAQEEALRIVEGRHFIQTCGYAHATEKM